MTKNVLKLFPLVICVLLVGQNLLGAKNIALKKVLSTHALEGEESTRPYNHSIAITTASSDGVAFSFNQDKKESHQQEQTVEQIFKNIQVLKGMPQSQFTGAMDFMMAALGVNCNYCHVGAWENDFMTAKRVSREMILMMRDINDKTFGGRMVVNCATCHQGRPKPVSAAPLDQDALRKMNAVDNPSSVKSLPTAEQLIDKYVRAVGGRAAFEKLNSRVIKSSLLLSGGATLSQEVYMKAPNKAVFIDTAADEVSFRGFDGTVGWSMNNQVQRRLKGAVLNQLRFNSEFNSEIRLTELFTEMRVTGKEKIGQHETYAVEAKPVYGDPQKLYFDARTGLLLRVLIEIGTSFGPILDQTDFSDYRKVDGVRLPFLLRRTSLFDNSTTKVKEVRHNIPIDDAKFSMPAAN